MKPLIETNLESIPDDLKKINHWVCWRYASSGDGSSHRWCKQPVSPERGTFAKTTCPNTWTDFGRAATYFQRNQSRLAGIGFVFTGDDPFVGVDLDHCCDPATGNLTEWASTIVSEIDSYTEVSPSGTGVKIILKSDQAVTSRRKLSPGIEIYNSQRFFTLTGHVLDERRQVRERTEPLLSLHQRHFPNADSTVQFRPQESETVAATEDQIMNRASRSRNGEKFQALWNGSTHLHAENQSQADLALCRILAFWCGPRPKQIDRLFRRSKLYRSKWDESHYAEGTTYGEATILKAIEAQHGTFYHWPTSRSRAVTPDRERELVLA